MRRCVCEMHKRTASACTRVYIHASRRDKSRRAIEACPPLPKSKFPWYRNRLLWKTSHQSAPKRISNMKQCEISVRQTLHVSRRGGDWNLASLSCRDVTFLPILRRRSGAACYNWLRSFTSFTFQTSSGRLFPSPTPLLSSPQYFLMLCRARVGGVFWLFDLEPKYSPCRHLVLSTKNSPTITLALSYPRWQSSYLWSKRHVWVQGAEILQAK